MPLAMVAGTPMRGIIHGSASKSPSRYLASLLSFYSQPSKSCNVQVSLLKETKAWELQKQTEVRSQKSEVFLAPAFWLLAPDSSALAPQPRAIAAPTLN